MTMLDGKAVLITGAGSGIGRSAAMACAAAGARLVLADIDADSGAESVKAVQASGGEALFARCDVTRSGEVEALVATACEHYGRLDGAINNAGIEGEIGRTTRWSEEGFDRTLAINVKGVWLCMKYEIAQMLEQGGSASIVNTASIAGLNGVIGGAGYVASKHAVVGLTKTAALEYGSKGVRINAVCPGPIETPMLDRLMGEGRGVRERFTEMEPMKRFGQPQEIADAMVWLLSGASSFVTGIALPVDGGWSAQ